jgi:hypothetical protein
MSEITFYRSRQFKPLTVIALGERRPEKVELVYGNGDKIVLSGRPRRVASKLRKIAGWLERLSRKNMRDAYKPYIRSFNNLKITVWPVTVWPVAAQSYLIQYCLIELYGPSGDDNDVWGFTFSCTEPKQVASEFYKIADWLEHVSLG